jgi:hypothetical protein
VSKKNQKEPRKQLPAKFFREGNIMDEHMTKAMDVLPEHMRGAMQRYIDYGIEPGSFLSAVICNDLIGAVGRADDINKYRIGDYCRFLYNDAPSDCWGSPAKYQAWISHAGMEGKYA